MRVVHPPDTSVVNVPKRRILLSVAALIVAGFAWFGVKQARCNWRNDAFARQVDLIKQDAHERLKVGTKKADVARFFQEHNVPFEVVGSQVYGTLRTTGCAPLGCGTDAGMIGVRVDLDAAGAVAREAIVVGMYTDCL